MDCFECGAEAHHKHHPIPHSLGGKKTIDLCRACHGKIHGLNFSDHGVLVRNALALRKKAGIPLGRPKIIIDKRTREKIRKLLRRGVSYRAVAVVTGLSKDTIWQRFKCVSYS